jgi:hypothetical protein
VKIPTRLVVALAMLFSLCAAIIGAPTQVIHAGAYIYDVPPPARVEVGVTSIADHAMAQANGPAVGWVERSLVSLGASTTPISRSVATNNLWDFLGDDDVYLHYTDAEGAASIASSGRLVAGPSGNVFVTRDLLSQAEAFTHLFAGNPRYAAKGSHVVAVRVPAGTPSGARTQANEIVFQGSVNVEVVACGPNPWG